MKDIILLHKGEQIFEGDKITLAEGKFTIYSIDYNELFITLFNSYYNIALRHTEFPNYLAFFKRIP